jgi:hypothetical protein
MRAFDDLLFVKISMIWGSWLNPTAMAGHFIVELLRPLHECDETNVVIEDPVGLTRLLLLVIGNRDRSMGKHVDCCIDAVLIVALEVAACFKTGFWALFEAEKAKWRTIGCRIVVATKLEPSASPSLLS